MQILHEKKVWYKLSIIQAKMSKSNYTLLDIYKFPPDIVRCPNVILSLDIPTNLHKEMKTLITQGHLGIEYCKK